MGLKRTDEFRPDAVRIALTSGLTRKQIASDLGVGMSTLNKWITAYRDTDVVSKGRGDLLKIIWWDQQGGCLFHKRLERGRFVWPRAKDGKVSLTGSQLAMLLEGIDWRMPKKTWWPVAAE